MNILVQKYGGTSVSTKAMRQRVLSHIQRELKKGYRLVVVVSAMGRRGDPYATDTLLELVRNEGAGLASREQDLLVSCGEIISAAHLASLLNQHQIKNCVLTGGQAGIITDGNYTNARIQTLNPKRILDELKLEKVVIVAGFQGQSHDGEITTLGRGGSDTTATALGAALSAERVDIYTDVNGIMTADPNIVHDAIPLEAVTYDEMCNFAFQGAKVIHPRAVEIAMQANLPICVRSVSSDQPGTYVINGTDKSAYTTHWHDRMITGVTQMANLTQIKVPIRKGQLDIQLKVFQSMAENGISVDFINVKPSEIAYTVYDEMADRAEQILQELEMEPILFRHCAKVSVIGAGIAGVPGVMAQIVEALTEEDIQIYQSADSHTTIWLLVRGEDMARSVRALHRKFGLHQ